jgi:hypothetical protein
MGIKINRREFVATARRLTFTLAAKRRIEVMSVVRAIAIRVQQASILIQKRFDSSDRNWFLSETNPRPP